MRICKGFLIGKIVLKSHACAWLNILLNKSNDNTIKESAFEYCINLITINGGRSVREIGNDSFYQTSITSTENFVNVIKIGSYAFYECRSLISVEIPNSVTNIGAAAFLGCSSLTSITIPDGAIIMSSSVFSGCSDLTCVVIPDSVMSIGAYVFYDCENLVDIIYVGTMAQWNLIEKESWWISGSVGPYTITCTDGTINKQ